MNNNNININNNLNNNNNNNNNKNQNKLKIQTARDKLKAYYGIQNNTETELGTTTTTAKKLNQLNSLETETNSNTGASKLDNLIKQGIDDTEFNPIQYTNKILKNCELKTLLQLNNQWVNDIKQLEGDKNNLIYNNYSKFLIATEAVGEVKTSLNDILPVLKGLQSSMDSVGGTLIKLNENYQPTRDILMETYTTNQLLKKSEFLLNLPKKLEFLLHQKKYSNLIYQLNVTQDSLEKYSNLNLFQSISKDCEGIRERVKIELYKELEVSKESIGNTSKLINSFISLEPDNIDYWFNYYLTYSKSYLIKVASETARLDLREGKEEAILELIKLQDKEILPNLSDIIDKFKILFLCKTNNDYIPITLKEELKEEYSKKFKSFCLLIYNNNYIELFDKSIKSNNLTLILNCFNYHLNQLNLIDLLSTDKLVDLKGNFKLIIISWYSNYLKNLLVDTNDEIKAKFLELFKLEEINLNLNLTNITSLDNFNLQSKLILSENFLLEELIKNLLTNLQQLLINNFEFWKLTGLGDSVLELLKSNFKQFWLNFIDNTIEEIILENPLKNLNLILILTKFTNDCYLNLIETIYLTYIQNLIQDNPILQQLKLNEEKLMKVWISECRDLNQIYNQKAKDLLNRFCINYGQYLVQQLVDYYDNNMDDTVNIDQFDPVYLEILIRFHLLEREICIVFDINQNRDNFDNTMGGDGQLNFSLESNKRGSINRSSFQSNLGGLASPSYRNSIGLPPSSPNLNNNEQNQQHWLTKINRLFYDRIEYYPIQTNFNLKEILNNIINILLKGYSEYIRLNYYYLSSLKLSKINLNLINWKLNLPNLIINSNNFNNLIEEIITSLVKRSLSSNSNSSNYQNLDGLLNTIYSRDLNWLYLNKIFNFLPISNSTAISGSTSGNNNQYLIIKEED